jgi:hypothetical protein
LWGGVIVFSSSVGVFTGAFIILTGYSKNEVGLRFALCRMPDTFIYIRASRLISVDELRNCTRGNPEATSVFGANDYRCLHHGPVPRFCHRHACTWEGKKKDVDF